MPRDATKLQNAYLAQPAPAETHPARDSYIRLRLCEETKQRFRFTGGDTPDQRWTDLRASSEQRRAQRLLVLRRQLRLTLGQPAPDRVRSRLQPYQSPQHSPPSSRSDRCRASWNHVMDFIVGRQAGGEIDDDI